MEPRESGNQELVLAHKLGSSKYPAKARARAVLVFDSLMIQKAASLLRTLINLKNLYITDCDWQPSLIIIFEENDLKPASRHIV